MAFERPLYPTKAFTFLEADRHQNPTFQSANLSEATEPQNHSSTLVSPPESVSDSGWETPQRRTKCPLDIIVVGAGLGGLATAIALTLSGHKVRVFEQAAEFGEVGAGIQVPPNSTRHFLSWGVGPHIEKYISEPHTINIRRWKDGSIIGTTHLAPGFRERYRAPYFVLHRADYHSALMSRATELGVEIYSNSEITSYEFSSEKDADFRGVVASVLLKNGLTHSADLVIGTDGIKSLARTTVLESHNHRPVLPTPTGQAAYRCTIPLSALASNPLTSWVTERPNQNLWVGPGCHSMTYAIGGMSNPARLFNLVLSHKETRPPEEWPTDIVQLKEEVQQTFGKWDKKLVDILTQVLEHPTAKAVKWPIMTTAPLPTWIHRSGKMIVLGDAAHAMVPYMSQGAAIAVEDAAAIATALSFVTTKDEVSKALEVVQKVRKIRAEGMQQASLLNGEIWHLDDGPLQRARDMGMGEEDKTYERGWNSNQWSDSTCQQWTYGYDAVEQIRQAWLENLGALNSQN